MKGFLKSCSNADVLALDFSLLTRVCQFIIPPTDKENDV